MTKMEDLSKIFEFSVSDPGETLFLVEKGNSLYYNVAVSALSKKRGFFYESDGDLWRREDGKVIKIREISGTPEKSAGVRSLKVLGLRRCMTWEERTSYEEWKRG